MNYVCVLLLNYEDGCIVPPCGLVEVYDILKVLGSAIVMIMEADTHRHENVESYQTDILLWFTSEF